MNLIRVDAQFRCSPEQAQDLIGLVDHVEYGSDTGIARLHFTETSADHLLADTAKAVNRLEELVGAAGARYEDVLEVSIGTEALIEDSGVWRRRGAVVMP